MDKVAVGLFAHEEISPDGPFIEELPLSGKKSMAWLLDRISGIADCVIVVSRSHGRLESMERIMADDGRFEYKLLIEDSKAITSMSIAALSGLADEDSMLVMPTFSPLIPVDVLSLVVELLDGRHAVFVRDRTGGLYKYLFSVRVEEGRNAFGHLRAKEEDLYEIPQQLRRTMTISWTALSTMDPLHLTFFRIRSRLDLPLGEKMLSRVGGS